MKEKYGTKRAQNMFLNHVISSTFCCTGLLEFLLGFCDMQKKLQINKMNIGEINYGMEKTHTTFIFLWIEFRSSAGMQIRGDKYFKTILSPSLKVFYL